MVTYSEFRANAQREGICDEYIEIWEGCGSKKQLMDMALGVKAVDYLCDAIAKGWGISAIEICKKFNPFINGKYVLDNGDYTSAMYCKYQGAIICETTLLTLIECNIDIIVPKYHICEIYACGKCKINIKGEGQALVVTYGNEEDVVLIPSKDIKCKRLRKKDRDR